MRVIPAIDIKNGACVRLFQGDFEQTTRYSTDPTAVGRRFSALNVRDLHIVDLDGARTGSQQNHSIVAAIAQESGLDVQLGGGIRSRDIVAQWLENGVSRCVIGSVAIEEPDTVRRWLAEFGPERIVLALDVKLDPSDQPMLKTHGWTRDADISLWHCLESYSDAGLRHLLCTDVGRDGAMTGPNFDLYSAILERYPALALQASGGVRHAADLRQLQRLGVPAAITGRALLDGAISETEVASFQQSA